MTSRGTRLLLAAVAILFCVFALNASAASLLKKGSRGNSVMVLQHQLQTLGYFHAAPTGYFGYITEKAVKDLQRDYDLQVDGIVGWQTQSLISQLLNKPKTGIREVMGFYVGDEPDIPSSFATLAAQKEQITSISPFWYRLDPNQPGKLEACGVTREEIDRAINFNKKNNIKTYALVNNILYGKNSIGRDAAHAVLADAETRWALVMDIFKLLKSKGFDGVCMDIENIYPADRNLYIQFLAELRAQLKPAGYEVVVCVPAKTSDKPNGGWGDNFDYAKVGKYADRVMIMTYDEHGSYSSAGPVASINWVEGVVKYALTKLPPGQILLGIPGYGFDWNVDQKSSRYISHWMAMEIARKNKKSIQWDAAAQVPYFNYEDADGSRHRVYFENASSTAGKLDLVNKYNLRGIAIWRLGMEDPDTWRVIKSKF